MASLFKQEYLRYAMFLVGAILIFLWARSRGTTSEGFENNGLDATYVTASPYNFEMYYADWCPHCHSALPEFEKLGAKQTIGGKTVACKAIEAEKNPELVRGKVQGYPTIQLYDPQGNMVQEYSGQRTATDFQQFLEAALNKN